MRVNEVSGINFRENKQRYVSDRTMQNAQKLLRMMNSETKYSENPQGTSFTSDILASVSLGKKVRFVDNRFLVAPTSKNFPNSPDTSLYIGNKYITFNSVNGKIFRYKKGFFSTFRGFLSDIDKIISSIATNYNNSEIVRKNSFPIQGFTQKGLNILKNHIK